MAYEDKEKQKEYQKLWIKKRRDEWISSNGPCKSCGSTEKLEVDHVDPSTKKLNPARVWSLSKEKRQAELSKCQVLCELCHQEKTSQYRLSLAPEHGPGAYARGCRCEVCRRVSTEQKRAWRERTGKN